MTIVVGSRRVEVEAETASAGLHIIAPQGADGAERKVGVSMSTVELAALIAGLQDVQRTLRARK